MFGGALMLSDLSLPLKKPSPNFDELQAILKYQKAAQKVHFVELWIDSEVISEILVKYLDECVIYSKDEDPEKYWKQRIKFWYKMGYDYIRVADGIVLPKTKMRVGKDTSMLSKPFRGWVEERTGVISAWKDFERYPWSEMEKINYSSYEIVSKNLPDGMKMMIAPSSGVFEIVSENLFGFENLFFLIHDDPELVKVVFDKVGSILYEFYSNARDIENVGGFFQGDDLGFKTSTFLSPEQIKKLVLCWHKKYAALAHEKCQMYWFHSCGNISSIMEYLIKEVRIDALHSFQDGIKPVTEFKHKYDHRLAFLGGVDVDILSRSNIPRLRKYVRNMINKCMPYGWALGSGNSIANYIPIENYLTMLDEGLK